MANEQESKQPSSVPPIALATEASQVRGGEEAAALPGGKTFDGVDNPNLDPQHFLGLPIFDAAPSHEDLEGRIVAMDDLLSIRRLYLFLSGAWRAFAPYLGAYAEIYLGNSTKNLTCTNAGQAYLIGDGSGVGTNGITAGGATAEQNQWKVTPPAGNFRVTLSLSFSVDRTCKLDLFAFQSAALENVYAELDVQAANKIYSVSMSGLAALTAAAVNPKVVSDTAGAVITWQRINLNVQSV